jgi:hypothetical protein
MKNKTNPLSLEDMIKFARDADWYVNCFGSLYGKIVCTNNFNRIEYRIDMDKLKIPFIYTAYQITILLVNEEKGAYGRNTYEPLACSDWISVKKNSELAKIYEENYSRLIYEQINEEFKKKCSKQKRTQSGYDGILSEINKTEKD